MGGASRTGRWPQRPATEERRSSRAKRPAARRVIGQKAVWALLLRILAMSWFGGGAPGGSECNLSECENYERFHGGEGGVSYQTHNLSV